ncbi:MAG: ACT domain-containing protein [Terriglobales bacterium]
MLAKLWLLLQSDRCCRGSHSRWSTRRARLAGAEVGRAVRVCDDRCAGVVPATACRSGIPIFAISTFDTDYVLIKPEHLEAAVEALGAAGHEKVDEPAG